MNKILCKLKDIGTINCSEIIDGKVICDRHNKIYDIWLGAGGFFLEINLNITKDKVDNIFVEDLKSINENLNNEMNQQNFHYEFQKRFNTRNFVTENLVDYFKD